MLRTGQLPKTGLACALAVPWATRKDLREFIALQVQYGYNALRRDQAIRALALRAGFTF